jgi:hypothetical protein
MPRLRFYRCGVDHEHLNCDDPVTLPIHMSDQSRFSTISSLNQTSSRSPDAGALNLTAVVAPSIAASTLRIHALAASLADRQSQPREPSRRGAPRFVYGPLGGAPVMTRVPRPSTFTMMPQVRLADLPDIESLTTSQ